MPLFLLLFGFRTSLAAKTIDLNNFRTDQSRNSSAASLNREFTKWRGMRLLAFRLQLHICLLEFTYTSQFVIHYFCETNFLIQGNVPYTIPRDISKVAIVQF